MTEGEALSARRSIKESKRRRARSPAAVRGAKWKRGGGVASLQRALFVFCVLRFIGYARPVYAFIEIFLFLSILANVAYITAKCK